MSDFRRKVWFWVTETQYNRTLRDGKFWDAVVSMQDTLIERPAVALLCRVLGHQPTMDHCCIPDHDFCFCCGKRMPGMARERRTATPSTSDPDGR